MKLKPRSVAQLSAGTTALGLAAMLGVLFLAAAPQGATAATGLSAPGADALWPQWQARVALQLGTLQNYTQNYANPSPGLQLGGPSLAGKPLDGSQASRSLQGGALLGDYYFARPFFGNFRASGGVVVGGLAGLPAGVFNPSSQAATSVGISLLGGRAGGGAGGAAGGLAGANLANNLGATPSAEGAQAAPYLGLGFTGTAWHNRVSFSADLGLVSDRPRALFGNQGVDNALRDMRLSPVMQLGLRYSF